jgi:hypothetical protein
MSWLWLGLLALAVAGFWIHRRRRLQADAMLQDELDSVSPEAEPKRPPAKQPWQRPGFGPAPRMDALEFGSGPVPPAAGGGEDPNVAGPMPDDEDIPALIPIEMPEDEEPPSIKLKLPPPPPPQPEPNETSDATLSEPADTAASPLRPPGAMSPAELMGVSDDEEFAPIRDPQVLDLPPELASEARSLMERKQEVAAVRLVCDTMGVGILDAQRTVRALVGR